MTPKSGTLTRSAGFAAVGVAAGLLAACSPPHRHDWGHGSLRSVSSLNCPDAQGDLKLASKTADGKSCAYASGDDQVTLSLVALGDQTPDAALAPLEAQLAAQLPSAVRPTPSGATAESGWDQGSGEKDRVDLDLPGIHIHRQVDGHADIDAGGVHISAQDGPRGADSAHVVVGDHHGGVSVDAHDGGAQIRVDESGSGVRKVYILESDEPGPQGYRIAGYEARGPSAGPIVVAKILAKSHNGQDLRGDVRDLLRLNVGG